MEKALQRAIERIGQMEAQLSTYQPDSAISQLNRNNQIQAAPYHLLEVVRLCEHWLARSDRLFSCRMGQVIQYWREAEALNLRPQRPEVRAIARKAVLARPDIRANGQIRLGADMDLEISGIGKGYIIDQTMAFLRHSLPEAYGIKVDIGGDARYWGKPTARKTWQVAVSDPKRADDNAPPLLHLALNNKAVAMSGHSHRARTIGRHTYSHILAPRDGWPVEAAASSVVIADTAADADAAATAMAAQAPAAAIDWINRQEGLEALLILPDGRQLSSEQFFRYRRLTGHRSHGQEPALC